MNDHHPWCNFFSRPREGCTMCDRFFAKYPLDGGTAEQLLVKHFPDVAAMNGVKAEPEPPGDKP